MDRRNVVYIFGAGASAGAIPVLAGWLHELEIFSDCLNAMIVGLDQNAQIPAENREKYRKFIRQAYNDSVWLLENSNGQYTIDTYAKKLYIRKDDEGLARLKRIVSTFLVFYQTQEVLFVTPTGRTSPKKFHKIRDPRYETLFSYLLGKGETKIPANVKFICWNYDAQIELALAQFIDDTNSIVESITNNRSQVYRVNGIAGSSNARETATEKLEAPFHWLFHRNYQAEELITLCYETLDFGGGIRYAWEYLDSNSVPNRIGQLSLDSATAVVIVGYSFPFFNSQVDKIILTTFFSSKVHFYLQYPNKEHNTILEKIRALEIPGQSEAESEGRFHMITGIDTFYVPYGV